MTRPLMARDDRHLWVGQVAIDDMQIRAADAASGHLHSNRMAGDVRGGDLRSGSTVCLRRGPLQAVPVMARSMVERLA